MNLLIWISLSSLLQSKSLACILYTLEDTDKYTTKIIYASKIKAYFITSKKLLTFKTVTDSDKAFFLEATKNKDNEEVKIYRSEKAYYAIYSKFDGGIRIIYDKLILDAINCKTIDR